MSFYDKTSEDFVSIIAIKLCFNFSVDITVILQNMYKIHGEHSR